MLGRTQLPSTRQRRRTIAAAILGAGLIALGGCGPLVKHARYSRTPQTVRRGSMLGPFEGRVVDADTNVPIGNAIVRCSWAFVRGIGSPAPEAVRTAKTRTDPDGHYRIEGLRDFPVGLSTRLARLSLTVYHSGYVAYRHDRRFGVEQRVDFAQLRNVVRLSRWSPELSYASHLLFLGGTRGLDRKERSRLLLAAADELAGKAARKRMATDVPALAGRTPGESARSGLAAQLLTSDELRKVTGFHGKLRAAPLENPGDADDTLHFRAVGRPERYDVAIRVWRAGGDALTEKYEALLAALPGSKQKDELADRSFVVLQGEIYGLGFMDSTYSALVLLTCGRGQCTSEEPLRKLAKRLAAKLSALPAQDPQGQE